ncbi:MAG: CAP domain-containing protein [Actinomycetes bacterium]
MAVAALLAVVSFSTVLTSCETTSTDRAQVFNLVNKSRAAAGLRPLRANTTLDMKADNWAQKLRSACKIWHSKLSDGAPSNWVILGENVGEGASISVVPKAYMDSPGHRANILDRRFTQIGTGAVWGNCGGYRRVFTVQVFMGT